MRHDGAGRPDHAAARQEGDPPKVSRKDEIVLGIFYLLCALTVRSVPRSRWGLLPHLLAHYQTRKPTPDYLAFQRSVRAVLGDECEDRALLALRRQQLTHVHRRCVLVAALRRRRSWDPSIALIGGERLEAALARGRGAILWFDEFSLSAIVGKRAFAEAGYSLWHLSAEGHGFLNSPRGERFLNHRVVEVEQRYLAGRIVFNPSSAVTATRRMVEILAANGVVSLTNNAGIGKKILVPFGQETRLPLARAPLSLVASRGAALLPVSVIETEPFSNYRVIVGPDLTTQAAVEGPDPIEAMAQAYAAYLTPLVKAYPAQWDSWSLLHPA